MSPLGDIFSAIKTVFLIQETQERIAKTVDEFSADIRDHEGRLIRIETTLDLVSKYSRRTLPGK
jgi:hypothetical protein